MGLKEDIIKEMKEVIADNKKVTEKKFRYPFGKKVSKGQRRKNYITVLVVNDNGTCDFKKYQIQDLTIMHNLIPRLATADLVLFDRRGNPLIILPSWSIEPFNRKQHFEDSMNNGSSINAYRILMAEMVAQKVEQKKKIGNWIFWVAGLLIVGLIVYVIASGGGK